MIYIDFSSIIHSYFEEVKTKFKFETIESSSRLNLYDIITAIIVLHQALQCETIIMVSVV